MSFKHKINFQCDGCGQQHILEEGMELPPRWLGVQIAFSNSDGIIPKQEQECFCHFCNIECFGDFVSSQEIKDRLLLVDEEYEDDEDDEEYDDDDDNEGDDEEDDKNDKNEDENDNDNDRE